MPSLGTIAILLLFAFFFGMCVVPLYAKISNYRTSHKPTMVIGLIGEIAAGKGTAASIIEDFAWLHGGSVIHLRFGDILLDTLQSWGIEATRAALQKLAVVMDQAYGIGSLSRAMEKRILSANASLVIVDGIRWQSDIELFERLRLKNVILYITANTQTRFERAVQRKEKAGEDSLTFEAFLQQEQAPNEVRIREFGERYGVKIKNDGTMEDLKNLLVNACARHFSDHAS